MWLLSIELADGQVKNHAWFCYLWQSGYASMIEGIFTILNDFDWVNLIWL